MASVDERNHLRSAEAFAAGLHAPLSPSICPTCFALFVNTADPDTPLMKLVQTKCHALLGAMMSFVASDWTPERQASTSDLLMQSLSRCTKCKPAGRLLHKLPGVDSWFGLVFEDACSCLRACGIRQMLRGKGFVSKRGLWPTSADQLFPYGPERTLESLIARLDQYYFFEEVIVIITALNRPVAFPVLSKDENRTRVIRMAVARIMKCQASVASELAALGEPIDRSAGRITATKYMKPYKGTALMLHTIAFGPDHAIDEHKVFFRSHEAELFQALHPLVLLLYDDEDYSWMGPMAGQLWLALSNLQRETCGCPDVPVYGQGIMEYSDDLGADPYRALLYFLSQRPTLRQCDGPGCRRTVHDNGIKFSRCGRCRIMQYCSKNCQKSDWTEGSFPHKQICDLLQELYTFASLDMSLAEFAAACRAHNYPLERVDRLIAWATDGETTSDYAGGAVLVDVDEH